MHGKMWVRRFDGRYKAEKGRGCSNLFSQPGRGRSSWVGYRGKVKEAAAVAKTIQKERKLIVEDATSPASQVLVEENISTTLYSILAAREDNAQDLDRSRRIRSMKNST